ncbi:MAG: hypothetical protein ACO21X_02950 [Sediminibacterium sp.]
MKRSNLILTLTLVVTLLVGVHTGYAAFTLSGVATEKRGKQSKFTLKNLNLLNSKSLSYSSLRSAMQYKSIQTLGLQLKGNNISEMNSMLRFDNGNSSFVFPYKFKVKVPKFKTPSPATN